MCDESWALGLNDAVSRKPDGNIRGFSLPFYMGADLIALAITLIFSTRFSFLPTVLAGIASAFLLRHLM